MLCMQCGWPHRTTISVMRARRLFFRLFSRLPRRACFRPALPILRRISVIPHPSLFPRPRLFFLIPDKAIECRIQKKHARKNTSANHKTSATHIN